MELDYESQINIFIIFKQLFLTLINTKIINTKLYKNLKLYQIVKINFKWLYIYSLLRLVYKHNRSWKNFYHLSYTISYLVNNHVLHKTVKIIYLRFQNILYRHHNKKNNKLWNNKFRYQKCISKYFSSPQ